MTRPYQPPDPSSRIDDPVWREFYEALISISPQRTGTATFTSTSVGIVILTAPVVDELYNVHLDTGVFASLRVPATSKSVDGFTIEAATSITGTVGWTLIRRV